MNSKLVNLLYNLGKQVVIQNFAYYLSEEELTKFNEYILNRYFLLNDYVIYKESSFENFLSIVHYAGNENILSELCEFLDKEVLDRVINQIEKDISENKGNL